MALNTQPGRHSKNIRSAHPEKAFLQMDLMRRDKRFTDVVLVAEGRLFPAHRSVLCSCSPYFDRMFQPGFREQDNQEVILKDFDADTLSSLLDFMYTAQMTITEENAQDILIGANLLLLYEVKEAAGEVLARTIDDTNVLVIRSLGNVFSCREVEFRAHNYMLERFEYVSKTEEFLSLPVDELEKLLTMDDIIVKSEESIFECILRWIQKDPTSRTAHFDRLVQCVRFPLVTDHYLETEMQEVELVQASPSCLQLIKEARQMRLRRQYTPASFLSGAISMENNTSASEAAAPATGSRMTTRQPQYRGSNQLLFLQCSNNSPWLKTPPVLYDFKRSGWSTLGGPHPPCRYREDSTFVFHNGAVLGIGGEYTVDGAEGHQGLPLGAGHLAAAAAAVGGGGGAVQVMLGMEAVPTKLHP